jgi:gas vesicle protein
VFGRRQAKTQNAMMREEFGEGVDHLRMAAAHAAGSAAGMIAPRLDMMRERMIEPTVDRSMDMARDGARRAGTIARRATGKQAPTMTARRWPRMVGGLMIAGAVVGAVSALLSRRRQRKWNEYGSTGNDITEETRSIADSARSAASSMTETAKEKASDVMGQMKGASDTSPMSPGTGGRTDDLDAQGGSFTSGTATGSGSRNGRP